MPHKSLVDLFDNFTFRIRIPVKGDRALGRKISDWLDEKKLTDNWITYVGIIHNDFVFIADDDEELVTEVILRWNGIAERCHRSVEEKVVDKSDNEV